MDDILVENLKVQLYKQKQYAAFWKRMAKFYWRGRDAAARKIEAWYDRVEAAESEVARVEMEYDYQIKKLVEKLQDVIDEKADLEIKLKECQEARGEPSDVDWQVP